MCDARAVLSRALHPLLRRRRARRGDACVPICGEGERIDNGNCISVCRDGERFSNGRCHSVCERAEIWEDGRCVPGCDRGLILRDGRCVPDCQAGFHIEGDTCVPDCGPGYRAVGSRCVLDCPPGTYEQGGRCRRSTQCSEGTRLQNGQCIPLGASTGLDEKNDGIQVHRLRAVAPACLPAQHQAAQPSSFWRACSCWGFVAARTEASLLQCPGRPGYGSPPCASQALLIRCESPA